MKFIEWLKSLFTKKTPVVQPLPKVNDSKPIAAPAKAQPVNPEYVEAQKYRGMQETDPKLQKKLVPYWKKIGLGSIGTLVGSSAAWCMLIVFAMATDTGQQIVKTGLAKVGGKDGQEINYMVNGIPKGARVWKNSSDCKSSEGNHIGWADGDCTAEDLKVSAATYPSFGGNQNNGVNTTHYCVKGDCKKLKEGRLVPDLNRICRVSWPDDLPLPGKVTKSVNCPKVQPKEGSTR